MMEDIVIKSLVNLPYDQDIEFVERKGLGHPDTICDLAAEKVSNRISEFYLKEYGAIMHYNVDKALLVGGSSRPSYNGGKILQPIEFTIAGRASMNKKSKITKIKKLAVGAINEHFDNVFRFIDVSNHLNINVNIRPGSMELVEMYGRIGKGKIPLSNDTSIGTGFYPFDDLENIVYKTEKFLNSQETKTEYPFIGEDIKVMGLREKNIVRLTIAIAIIDRFILDLDDYKSKISDIRELLSNQQWIKPYYEIYINTADSYQKESIYITVIGTSAENGDDGQVGRGNRANGLITPNRSMTLEAVAGKNPISHVGKIYNFFAKDLSKAIVESGYGSDASVHIVSQIGKPINQPQILEIRIKNKNAKEDIIIEMAREMLQNLPLIWKKIIVGEYEIA